MKRFNILIVFSLSYYRIQWKEYSRVKIIRDDVLHSLKNTHCTIHFLSHLSNQSLKNNEYWWSRSLLKTWLNALIMLCLHVFHMLEEANEYSVIFIFLLLANLPCIVCHCNKRWLIERIRIVSSNYPANKKIFKNFSEKIR